MSRRRRERASLLEGDGEMSVMHIPGHEHQGPQEVTLEEIRAVMGNCQLCPLGQTRTNLVFGVGNPNARVMFVGEGPGRNEDLQGEPFVGAAGHKLDSLLSVAGLTRDQIYIANVVKCRPPGNRNPKPEEIAACSPFLREQIRSVWPDVLVCLGELCLPVCAAHRGGRHVAARQAVPDRALLWCVPHFTRRPASTTRTGNRFSRATLQWWANGCGTTRLARGRSSRGTRGVV